METSASVTSFLRVLSQLVAVALFRIVAPGPAHRSHVRKLSMQANILPQQREGVLFTGDLNYMEALTERFFVSRLSTFSL